MATDFSKVGNAVQVTVDGVNPKAYVGVPVIYSFNAAGTILSVNFGGGGSNTYDIALADLRVAGAGSAPANAAAAYTALGAVFGMFP